MPARRNRNLSSRRVEKRKPSEGPAEDSARTAPIRTRHRPPDPLREALESLAATVAAVAAAPLHFRRFRLPDFARNATHGTVRDAKVTRTCAQGFVVASEAFGLVHLGGKPLVTEE